MPYLDLEKVDERTREKLEAIIEKSYHTYWKGKRLFDIFFATLILLFFLPLMVVIAIVIVIDDPSAGPFYKQIRETSYESFMEFINSHYKPMCRFSLTFCWKIICKNFS